LCFTSYGTAFGLVAVLFFSVSLTLTKRALKDQGPISRGVTLIDEGALALPFSFALYETTTDLYRESQEAHAEQTRRYRQDFAALRRVVADCRVYPAKYNQLTQSWVSFLDALAAFPDVTQKLLLINGYVNAVIPYDYVKFRKSEAAYKQETGRLWVQSPLETLARGCGICEDYEILKEASLYLSCGATFFEANVSRLHLMPVHGAFDQAAIYNADTIHSVVSVRRGPGLAHILDIQNVRPPEDLEADEPTAAKAWMRFFTQCSGISPRASYLSVGAHGQKPGYLLVDELLGNGGLERSMVIRKPRNPDEEPDVKAYVVIPTVGILPKQDVAAKPVMTLGSPQVAQKLSEAQRQSLQDIVALVRAVRQNHEEARPSERKSLYVLAPRSPAPTGR